MNLSELKSIEFWGVLLALCMEVLDEVLQQVHPLLDFDLIDFEEIL